ncbi:hypothetical protein [Kibdelosporangium philippinense]
MVSQTARLASSFAGRRLAPLAGSTHHKEWWTRVSRAACFGW